MLRKGTYEAADDIKPPNTSVCQCLHCKRWYYVPKDDDLIAKAVEEHYRMCEGDLFQWQHVVDIVLPQSIFGLLPLSFDGTYIAEQLSNLFQRRLDQLTGPSQQADVEEPS